MKTQLLKSISSLLFLAFATSTSVAQTAEKPNGSGTESDPYAIATLNNLYWLSQTSTEWDKHYRQTADIDASATSGWDIGDHDSENSTPDSAQGFSPIGNSSGGGSFQGSYDGQNFKVSGLMINRHPVYGSVGLFGRTESATIKNLGVTNVSITGNGSVGGLVGGNVFKPPDPEQYASTVTNCYTTGSVRGRDSIGGLVGFFNHSSVISKSYSTCSVIGTGARVGGLVGVNDHAYITDSYATGSVTGGEKVGGLVGTNGSSTVSNSYSTGLVSTESDSVGGLFGNGFSAVNNCFWDIETSGQLTSVGGEGKTTSEMKRTGTFISSGWDFEGETSNGIENIWDLDMSGVMNDGYPYLWYQDGDATSLDVSDAPVLPDGFAIHQNYPNPFNPTTTISYDLPKRSQVTLGIYDLLGKQIKTLVNQSQDAGNRIAVWDGTDDLGRPVSAGVYLYQIQAGEFTQTRKMLLLK
jgi:hypothetical protein